MADKNKGNIVVSDMRDYALITLMKTIRRLELLDEKRNNETDIAKIRRYINLFVQKALSENNKIENGEAMVDKFPEMLEISEEKDDKKANNLVKDLMKKWRKALLSQISDYKKLSENDCETVLVNTEKIYDEVFKPYIDQHNKARRNKDNQINRQEFVKSFMRGDIDDNIEKIVLAAKENILLKIKERKGDTSRTSLFNDELNSLIPGLSVDYQTSRNTAAVKQANIKVRSYFSKADADKYRKGFPDDLNARPVREGSKEDFLKMLGSMALTGYNQVHLGAKNSKSNSDNFEIFEKIMKKNYPQDTDEVINKTLGIGKNADREARMEAFMDKSASVYTQMLGGFIQLRADIFNDKSVNYNIIRSLKKYIDGMQNGVQDIQAMSLLLPEKDSGAGTIKQEQAKEQHINTDHKIPVASAITLYLKLHPELGGDLDPNKLKLKHLLELAEEAAPLVDNISNHRQVISKKLNNELEADGKLKLETKKDNSILAVRYSHEKVQKLIAGMPEMKAEDKERYKEAFSKYSKADKRGVITTSLNLPEAEILSQARKKNSAKKDILNARVLIEKSIDM